MPKIYVTLEWTTDGQDYRLPAIFSFDGEIPGRQYQEAFVKWLREQRVHRFFVITKESEDETDIIEVHQVWTGDTYLYCGPEKRDELYSSFAEFADLVGKYGDWRKKTPGRCGWCGRMKADIDTHRTGPDDIEMVCSKCWENRMHPDYDPYEHLEAETV
jgi:hypothetical protein